MMTRALGQPVPQSPPAVDVGDEAAAAFAALASSPGGGYAWVEGDECKGWLQVMGYGAGGSEWGGGKTFAGKVLMPRAVACDLAARVVGPFSYVETGLSNKGTRWTVRVMRPWTPPKSPTPIRSAIARWIFGTTVT